VGGFGCEMKSRSGEHSPENPSQAKRAPSAPFLLDRSPELFCDCFFSARRASYNRAQCRGRPASSLSHRCRSSRRSRSRPCRCGAMISSICLMSFRSRSRLRSSRAMSDSWLARSLGSANTVASSCIRVTVRSISCDSFTFSALEDSPEMRRAAWDSCTPTLFRQVG